MTPEPCVLAIDPGRDKCGIAVVRSPDAMIFHEVVATVQLEHRLSPLLEQFSPRRLLLGDGTFSNRLRPMIEQAVAGRIPLEVVNERHTTERARAVYWRHHPPRGLRRWIPLGLQVPPVPYDDYAAYIMACDHWAQLNAGKASPGPE